MKQKQCQKCEKPSIKGLKAGIGLCQYHYNERQWGKAWADKCVRETRDMMAGSKERKGK